VLIACLIGAIIVTRVRRRRRFARSSGTAMAARAGQGPGHARHARLRHALPAPVSAHSAVWTAGADGGHHRRQRRAESPPWLPAPSPDEAVPLPASPVRPALPSVRPALPSVRPALPSVRPALPAAAGPVPPWEESPADFAVAPPEDTALPRTGAGTGPMFVWNAGDTTGQFPAISDPRD
jgi:hypothetical protein